MKKYSDEFRKELHSKHSKGMTPTKISKEYGIPLQSVKSILRESASLQERCIDRKLLAEVYSNQEASDAKLADAENFKEWINKFKLKLKRDGKYLGQPVVHAGATDFTYRCRYGYTETIAFIDLYKKVQKK